MNDSVGVTPLQLYPCTWKKALCPKICKNKVLTIESVKLDYAQHSCMYSRTLILDIYS